MTIKKQDMSALQNALLNDASLRAVRNPKIFIDFISMLHHGFTSWNIVAQLGYISTMRRSAAIERITRFNQRIDTFQTTTVLAPPITPKNKGVVNFEDLKSSNEENGKEAEQISIEE